MENSKNAELKQSESICSGNSCPSPPIHSEVQIYACQGIGLVLGKGCCGETALCQRFVGQPSEVAPTAKCTMRAQICTSAHIHSLFMQSCGFCFAGEGGILAKSQPVL